MTFAVLIEPTDDQFAASIAGVPGLRVTGASREEAIAALKEMVSERIRLGELTTVEIEPATPANAPSKSEKTDEGKLPDWCNVYEGLTDEEINELESVILERADLSRPS